MDINDQRAQARAQLRREIEIETDQLKRFSFEEGKRVGEFEIEKIKRGHRRSAVLMYAVIVVATLAAAINTNGTTSLAWAALCFVYAFLLVYNVLGLVVPPRRSMGWFFYGQSLITDSSRMALITARIRLRELENE